MNNPTENRHVRDGMRRLERISRSFDREQIDAIGELLHASRVAEQPWLIAGVSDGMGVGEATT